MYSDFLFIFDTNTKTMASQMLTGQELSDPEPDPQLEVKNTYLIISPK